MTDMQEEFRQKLEEKAHHEHEKLKEKPHHPPHDLPPHILKMLIDLTEKVGKLEGQMEILLSERKR